MLTGDALSTARSSKADLRFNDGSFARVGELALFRFIPNTRQFNLSNGTALLLIPPGRGRTTIKTPNVSAGIRGSALFVRVDDQTGTTIVGALTNSGITVTDNVTNRLVELKAGQMAVADPRGLRLFDFDLTTFYQTSNMVRGLNLEKKPSEASSDKDIAAVQGETSEALSKQEKIPEEAVAKNLDFIKLSPQPSGFPEEKTATPLPTNLPAIGKVAPDIFDRGTLGSGQPTSSNPETPRVEQPGTPLPTPPLPDNVGPGTAPVPPPLPDNVGPGTAPVPPPDVSPGSAPVTPSLTPIQREPTTAIKAPEPAPILPTPAPVSPPIQVTPAPTSAPVVPSPTPNSTPTVPANNPSNSAVPTTPTLAPSLAPTIAPVLPLDGSSTPAQS
ncbi:FecR family protein [Phormidesmis priestleyi]|nr:FecR family protein [Phormidesmis priestleyi]